jgi:hypothetical protein
MNVSILSFLQRDIEVWFSLSFPYLSVTVTTTHTSRRNKTIQLNRSSAPQFILSANAEKTKRISGFFSTSEPALNTRGRYIKPNDCKGQFKNPYQVVLIRRNGGDRPC